GLLTDVTLKLTPLPRARRTFALPVADLAQGLGWATATVPAWLVISSVVLCSGVDLPCEGDAPYALLFTLEGVEEDILAEVATLRAALDTVHAPALLPVDKLHATTQWAHFLSAGGNAVTTVRAGVP